MGLVDEGDERHQRRRLVIVVVLGRIRLGLVGDTTGGIGVAGALLGAGGAAVDLAVAAASASPPGVSAGSFRPDPVAGLVSRLGTLRAKMPGTALPGSPPRPAAPYQLTAPAAAVAGHHRAAIAIRTSYGGGTGSSGPRQAGPGTEYRRGSGRRWSCHVVTAAGAAAAAVRPGGAFASGDASSAAATPSLAVTVCTELRSPARRPARTLT